MPGRTDESNLVRKTGAPDEVLIVGEMEAPMRGRGVRIRIAASGINPGDTKQRGDTFGKKLPLVVAYK